MYFFIFLSVYLWCWIGIFSVALWAKQNDYRTYFNLGDVMLIIIAGCMAGIAFPVVWWLSTIDIKA